MAHFSNVETKRRFYKAVAIYKLNPMMTEHEFLQWEKRMNSKEVTITGKDLAKYLMGGMVTFFTFYFILLAIISLAK